MPNTIVSLQLKALYLDDLKVYILILIKSWHIYFFSVAKSSLLIQLPRSGRCKLIQTTNQGKTG